ncbi:hypothetical protein J6590_085035 [Homalodisca vitripennis]|nr:hypothetical protein J6590_085035 [Homalodisca vitripennis]
MSIHVSLISVSEIFEVKTSLGALSVLVEGKIPGSRHRHANDTNLHEKTWPRTTNLHEKVSLAVLKPTNYTTGTRTAHKQHVVFSGRTQLCVTGVSMDLQALKVGKNSPSSVLHANDADLRTH